MARSKLGITTRPHGEPELFDPWLSLQFEASIARSLLGDDAFQKLVHNGGSSTTRLWWGPTVPIRDGDLVYYFKTASGRIAVEAVHTPQGLPTLSTMS